MVRLKGFQRRNRRLVERVFQFQMVRLKVSLSIHIGSQTDKVSIPNGTIKSRLQGRILPVLHSFQFQMVRLKDIQVNARLVGKLVSIPNGTIKSEEQSHTKVGEKCSVSIPNGTIKRPHRLGACHFFPVSIPNGTIKRWSCMFRLSHQCVSIPNGTIKRHRWWSRSGSWPRFNSKWYD